MPRYRAGDATRRDGSVRLRQSLRTSACFWRPSARQDRRCDECVNTWIEVERKDGTLDALLRYRILGQDGGGRRPRWSIIHVPVTASS